MVYEAKTQNIMVRVEPSFMDDESSPMRDHYFWAYSVEICNDGDERVKLVSRYWLITDSLGRSQEVRGAGVVGEQPVLEPGESFRYTSGAPLSTPSGVMRGHYVMESEDGESFEVEIPAFSLDSPYIVGMPN
jgi:ApaG protein